MENKLIYWKSAIEDLRGSTEPELVRALAFAMKRADETERVIFTEVNHEDITDRLLERVLNAIKRLPNGQRDIPRPFLDIPDA